MDTVNVYTCDLHDYMINVIDRPDHPVVVTVDDPYGELTWVSAPIQDWEITDSIVGPTVRMLSRDEQLHEAARQGEMFVFTIIAGTLCPGVQ